jgi:enoyl-CoA hydratase/carnithine racemase
MSAPSVNLAGVPSNVGGTFAAIVGWLVLVFGLAWALGAGLLLWAIFRVVAVALAVALPIALIALGIGVTMLLVSRYLRRRGALRRRDAHEHALMAWAAQSGSCTAEEAGRALGIPAPESDHILTDVAKRQPERLAMDVGDDGMVRYRPLGGFEGDRPGKRGDTPPCGVRISDEAARDQEYGTEIEGDQDAEDGVTRGRRRV